MSRGTQDIRIQPRPIRGKGKRRNMLTIRLGSEGGRALIKPNTHQVDIAQLNLDILPVILINLFCGMAVILHVLNIVAENQLCKVDVRTPTVLSMVTLQSAKLSFCGSIFRRKNAG